MATQTEIIEALQKAERPPVHPGQVVSSIMTENGLTQEALAAGLGVSRQTVNRMINGQTSITPVMANRLGLFFGNGARLWILLQQKVDLWETLHMDEREFAGVTTLKETMLQTNSYHSAKRGLKKQGTRPPRSKETRDPLARRPKPGRKVTA